MVCVARRSRANARERSFVPFENPSISRDFGDGRIFCGGRPPVAARLTSDDDDDDTDDDVDAKVSRAQCQYTLPPARGR